MWTYNYTDELCHYGVKGMRWGIRKAINGSISFSLNHPVATAAIGVGAGIARNKIIDKTYKPKNKRSYERSKKVLGNAINARKADKYMSKGMSVRQARNSVLYGKRSASRIENRMRKGDSEFKATLKDAPYQIGKAFAITTASTAVTMLATSPALRRSVARGAANVARQSYKYMRYTRYNKAVQLRSPAYRYVKAAYTVNAL